MSDAGPGSSSKAPIGFRTNLSAKKSTRAEDDTNVTLLLLGAESILDSVPKRGRRRDKNEDTASVMKLLDLGETSDANIGTIQVENAGSDRSDSLKKKWRPGARRLGRPGDRGLSADGAASDGSAACGARSAWCRLRDLEPPAGRGAAQPFSSIPLGDPGPVILVREGLEGSPEKVSREARAPSPELNKRGRRR
ncbi:hypothetical protein NDU88_001737 [Pleurodeles waltl]|uniref:Uncharacterized protein n=1 Tax=Pleurodeles waltl TaxID=8319 RepID=A0AAV7P827_PLEWA|nr:hypothetical protein NDU88_001737 [Pleurodeles waltl]